MSGDGSPTISGKTPRHGSLEAPPVLGVSAGCGNIVVVLSSLVVRGLGTSRYNIDKLPFTGKGIVRQIIRTGFSFKAFWSYSYLPSVLDDSFCAQSRTVTPCWRQRLWQAFPLRDNHNHVINRQVIVVLSCLRRCPSKRVDLDCNTVMRPVPGS